MTNSPLPQSFTPDTAPSEDRGRTRRKVNLRIAGLALGGIVVLGSVGTYFAVTGLGGRPVTDAQPAGVSVASVDGLGDVLVDGDGQTLYLFEPDEAADVTCTGGCATKWPPLHVDAGAAPEVASGIDASRVGMVADQDAANVITFDDWPLYRYVSDELGEVSGSGLDQNGGTWWALSPTGERIAP